MTVDWVEMRKVPCGVVNIRVESAIHGLGVWSKYEAIIRVFGLSVDEEVDWIGGGVEDGGLGEGLDVIVEGIVDIVDAGCNFIIFEN